MRKLFLFLSVIALGFTMNSCLDSDASFSDTVRVSYITSDDFGTTFARTASNIWIKSDEMGTTMHAGSFKLFSYKWEEAYGMTNVSINGQSYPVYNVKLTSDVSDVTTSYASLSEAPAQEGDSNLFTGFDCIFFDEYGSFLNDHWIMYYSCNVPKGMSPRASFYKSSETGSYNGSDVAIIDVRLTFDGTATGTTTTASSDYVAVNMAQVRSMLNGSSSTTKTSYVKFRYYLTNYTGLYTSAYYYPMTNVVSSY